MRRIAASPDASIAEALLDQRNLAGVGNLYKAETLFLRGLWPWTPVAEVPDLTGTVELAQKLVAVEPRPLDPDRPPAHCAAARPATSTAAGRSRAAAAAPRSRRPTRTTGSPTGARAASRAADGARP